MDALSAPRIKLINPTDSSQQSDAEAQILAAAKAALRAAMEKAAAEAAAKAAEAAAAAAAQAANAAQAVQTPVVPVTPSAQGSVQPATNSFEVGPGSFTTTDGTYQREEFNAQLNTIHPDVFTSAEDVTTTLAAMGIEVDPALAAAIFETSKSQIYTPDSPTGFTEGVRTSTLESLIFDEGTASAPGQTTPGALGLVANTDGTGAPLQLELDANASEFDKLRFGWSGDVTADEFASQLQAAGYGDPSANQNELKWLANAFGTNGELSWGEVSTLTQVGALNLGALDLSDGETPPTSVVNVDAAIHQALHGSSISTSGLAYGDLQSNPSVVNTGYESPSASTPYADDNTFAAQLREQGITIDPAQLSLYRAIQGGAAGQPTLTAHQLGQAISDGTYEYSVNEEGQLTLQLADPKLRTQDPTVVAALASAGMQADDIIRLAPTVSAEEVAKPGFITVLSAHLEQGESAIQSLTWARYTGLATTAELSSHQFRTDLNAAAAAGYGDTLESSVHYARSNALVRQLGGATDLDTVLALDDATVVTLQAKDPAVVQSLLEAGLSLPQVVSTSDADQQALLAEDPVVTKALLDAGMDLADVIAQAPSVSVEEAQTPAFTAKLQEKLSEGVPAADAITWARYSGVATDAELADAQFRTDLNAAAEAGYGDTLVDSVHYARANALVRHAAGAVDLPTALELDDPTLAALQQAAPQDISDFVALGLNLSQFTELQPSELTQLLAADPEVAKALLGAGVSLPAVAQVAGSVSLAEAQNTSFTTVLKQKLAADMPAADAVIWARYSGVATDAELADAQFRTDLNAAAAAGYGDTLADSVHYARSNALVRQLNGTVELDAVLALSDTAVQSLLAEDPQTIQPFIDRGVTLDQYLQSTPDQRSALLAADPVLTKALLGAGMSLADVATNAQNVTTEEANDPTFVATLTEKLSQGLSANDAILWARYSGTVSSDLLSDPLFLQDLTTAEQNGWGDDPLHYAYANQLVRMVDGAIDLPTALEIRDLSLITLLNVGPQTAKNFLAIGLTPDQMNQLNPVQFLRVLGSEPGVAKALLDAGLSLDQVGNVADQMSLAEAQSTTFTSVLQQKLTEGLPTQDAVIWARYTGVATDAELSDQQFRTDLSNAAAQGHGETLQDAVHYARANVVVRQLNGAADLDKVLALDDAVLTQLPAQDLSTVQSIVGADPTVVNALFTAGMSLTDTATYAKAVTPAEAQNTDFMASVKTNLELGMTPAAAIALARYGDVLTQQELANETFLQDLLFNAPAGSDDPIAYARAMEVVDHLSVNGQPAPAADLDSVLALNLNGAQVDNLLTLDPQEVRNVMSRGGTLAEISSLPAEFLTKINAMDAGYFQWLRGLGTTPTLAQIATLSDADNASLQAAYTGGYRLATADETFSDITPGSVTEPIDLNGWVLTFETDSGQKIVVTQQGNPALFAQAASFLRERDQAAIDAARAQNGLPPETSVDVMNLQTTIPVDPNDLSKGYMTVGQATIDDMIAKYRAGVEDGSIGHDDPRAQLVRALEARSALANGYSLLPYAESPTGWGDTTRRVYPGGEDNPVFMDMSPQDVAELLNPDAVNAKITALMGDPTIQADYQASLTKSVASLSNKQQLTDQLYNALTGDDYLATIKSLKDQGLGFQAEQMIQRDLGNLALLDPAKATEAAQTLSINSLNADMQTLAENPELLDPSMIEIAVKDAATIAIQVLRSSAAFMRHGTQAAADIIAYINEFMNDKESVTTLSNVIKQLIIDAKRNGLPPASIANATPAQLQQAMDETYLPLRLRNSVGGFIGKMQHFGLWGSIGGAGAVASFGYQMSQGAWSADSTPMERWLGARDIISFLSVSGHVTKTGAGIADLLMGTSPDAETDKVWRYLGLDRTLPEVHGHPSFGAPQAQSPAAQILLDEMASLMDDQASVVSSNHGAMSIPGWDDLTDAERQNVNQAVGRLESIYATEAGLDVITSGLTRRIAITTLKVLATAPDFIGGVGDIVVSAIGLTNAVRANDVGGIVGNSLSLAGGVALTGAGLIGGATLFAGSTLPALVTLAYAPLFGVGAVLAFGGFLAIVISGYVQRHRQLQGASEDQNQWFRDLANDGLADPEWANKLEYYHYAWTVYGNDNTDTANQSYIDFQRAEWEHFRDEPMSGGTSLWRLSESLHVYTDKTTEDPTAPDDSATDF